MKTSFRIKHFLRSFHYCKIKQQSFKFQVLLLFIESAVFLQHSPNLDYFIKLLRSPLLGDLGVFFNILQTILHVSSQFFCFFLKNLCNLLMYYNIWTTVKNKLKQTAYGDNPVIFILCTNIFLCNTFVIHWGNF